MLSITQGGGGGGLRHYPPVRLSLHARLAQRLSEWLLSLEFKLLMELNISTSYSTVALTVPPGSHG